MARGRSEAGSAITRSVVAALVLLGLTVIGAAGPTEPRLSLDPTRDFAGSRVNAQVSGFLPYEELTWRWDDEEVLRGAESADRAGTGGFAGTTLWVPDDAEPGRHEVTVTGESGSSASASFIVEARTDETVYRLPSSTTSTSTTEAGGAEPAAADPAEAGAASGPSSSTGTSTTTTRDARDVPDRFSVRLEDAGTDDGNGGPPSWLPALGPAAIVALLGGRLLVRHLTPGVDAGEARSRNPRKFPPETLDMRITLL